MKLMPDEKVLWASKSNNLVLTTHRVRSQAQSTGNAHIKTIMLEELASCTMNRTSNPAFLAIAAISLMLGILATIAAREPVWVIVGIVLAGIFIIYYFVSRKQKLSFASSGTTIKINASGMNTKTVRDIIEIAEAAKNERHLHLKG